MELSNELQDLSEMEAACLVRETMRRSGSMYRMIEKMADAMIDMAVELAQEKMKKGLDKNENESIIE